MNEFPAVEFDEGLDLPAQAAEVGEVLKKAAFVTVGSVAGSFLAKGLKSLNLNDYIANGLEAGIGIAAAVFGQRQHAEPLLWGGIGVAAHGLASLLAALIPAGPSTAEQGG